MLTYSKMKKLVKDPVVDDAIVTGLNRAFDIVMDHAEALDRNGYRAEAMYLVACASEILDEMFRV